jgi:hypothetical protein
MLDAVVGFAFLFVVAALLLLVYQAIARIYHWRRDVEKVERAAWVRFLTGLRTNSDRSY